MAEERIKPLSEVLAGIEKDTERILTVAQGAFGTASTMASELTRDIQKQFKTEAFRKALTDIMVPLAKGGPDLERLEKAAKEIRAKREFLGPMVRYPRR